MTWISPSRERAVGAEPSDTDRRRLMSMGGHVLHLCIGARVADSKQSCEVRKREKKKQRETKKAMLQTSCPVAHIPWFSSHMTAGKLTIAQAAARGMRGGGCSQRPPLSLLCAHLVLFKQTRSPFLRQMLALPQDHTDAKSSSCPLQRMRLRVKHPLIQTNQIVLAKDQVEVLERLSHPK